jgi:hypothetical protein
MGKDFILEQANPVDEPIVLPDECGDSMWDKVLEQSAFVPALQLVSNAEPEDKKT